MSRLRAMVAVVSVGAAVALLSISPANADQITGSGSSTSPLTVSWSQGLLGADNKTVVTPRDPSSPLSFMYPDFQNLKVTVSQTDDLVHQSVQVNWSGGIPTTSPRAGGTEQNFLQMMQCYGDSNNGPDPEDCEYGSTGLLTLSASSGGTFAPQAIGGRAGSLCVPGAVASVSSPPGTADGSPGNAGCDPLERNMSSDIIDSDPTDYNVPFLPVGTTTPLYGVNTQYYDRFNTNEIQFANTDTNGTGQVFFETLTATESPGLGCGQIETDGSTRNCWLVIVPRGSFLPNGATDNVQGINDSPLGASNWAQRIQIHLNFDPLQPDCPIGSAQERGTVGTQLVSRAVFSWQLALNQAADCKTIYGYAATPEATSTNQLADTTGAGLAFTTIPIGSEADRSGGGTGTGPPLVYAPVTASAITFAFNINLVSTGGFDTKPIKLTPRLVAKALTQSYREDLPDFQGDIANALPDSKWALKNPDNITLDPEFQKLNPGVTDHGGNPIAPLLTEDHSSINQQLWAWIQADPAAKKWLAGTPDENGMVVNPNYKGLKLGSAPAIDSFPRADPTCFDFGTSTGIPPKEETRCALDLLPYVNNYDDAAARVRGGNNPLGATWDPNAQAPDGSTGWWGNGGIEPAGQVYLWAITDSASLASYGLVPADLCDDSGNNCVAPDTASVTAALNGAKADSSGLLQVNPATISSSAYPLVQVSYAAVRTTQSAAALEDFASLINFAASTGQTAGDLPGNLPHGYLPLPTSLRSQATKAATKLVSIAHGTASPSPSATGTSTTTTSTTTTTGVTVTTPPVVVPPSGSVASASPTGPAISQQPAAVATGTTKGTPVGAVRWALIAIVVTGLVGAAGGPLVRIGRRSGAGQK
ncbi:MAG TPA: hypothetical protein VGJ28_07595 [Micromonosporaceae bacterium]